MLLSVRDLESVTIGATDGDIGSVHDVDFDDQSWTVRYLAVDTGTWLPGRRVLISLMSVRELHWGAQRLAVDLTKEQIENSPAVDSAGSISRQSEQALVRHYGLDPYWFGPHRWGAVAYPYGPVAPPLGDPGPPVDPEVSRALEREGWQNVGPAHVEERHLKDERGVDAHLRSAREVIGYDIQALDGEIGHVEDFLVDDRTWAIRYLIVDTRNWLPGKKVVVAPEWVEEVSWSDSKVVVSLTREQIEHAPEYDPSRPLEREHELRLYEHYGRPTYWDREDREDRDRAA
jgi:uncharacterized protein YrrD